MASETERQRFFFGCWSVVASLSSCFVVVVVFHARMQLRILTLLLDGKTLFKLSAGRIHSNILAIWCVPVNEILD